jgi:hypothetical protein
MPANVRQAGCFEQERGDVGHVYAVFGGGGEAVPYGVHFELRLPSGP